MRFFTAGNFLDKQMYITIRVRPRTARAIRPVPFIPLSSSLLRTNSAMSAGGEIIRTATTVMAISVMIKRNACFMEILLVL